MAIDSPTQSKTIQIKEEALLSFVVPIYDEVDNLRELANRIGNVCDELYERTQVIFVDDGSQDGSADVLRDLCSADSRFSFLSFSRNFGHQAAITAGLDAADGDAVIVMDGDLQHPPELVPELVEKWREGYEVVYAIRGDRAGEKWLKRKLSVTFYRLLKRLTDTDMTANAGDFRLIDRSALQAFRQMRERNRYLRGMFNWLGFRQIGVPYGFHHRHAGAPKYTFRRMVQLAVAGITSFTNAPLHLALHLGFLMSGLSFLLGIFAIGSRVLGFHVLPGWVSIMVGMSFIGGVQLFVMGVLGVYLGRMYEEVKRRPIYVVSEAGGLITNRTQRNTPLAEELEQCLTQ